jgi:hypothetical protein
MLSFFLSFGPPFTAAKTIIGYLGSQGHSLPVYTPSFHASTSPSLSSNGRWLVVLELQPPASHRSHALRCRHYLHHPGCERTARGAPILRQNRADAATSCACHGFGIRKRAKRAAVANVTTKAPAASPGWGGRSTGGLPPLYLGPVQSMLLLLLPLGPRVACGLMNCGGGDGGGLPSPEGALCSLHWVCEGGSIRLDPRGLGTQRHTVTQLSKICAASPNQFNQQSGDKFNA